MNLRKLFLIFTGGLILTHALNSFMIGTPLIGIVIWSFPLAIFFLYVVQVFLQIWRKLFTMESLEEA